MAQVAAATTGQSRNPPLDPYARIKWAPSSSTCPPSTKATPRLLPPYARAGVPPTGLERATVDRTLSPQPPPPGIQLAPSRSRAFFDVVLADPLPPTPMSAGRKSINNPVAPPRKRSSSGSKPQNGRKRKQKRRQPTPDESSEEDSHSEDEEELYIDDDSDEDEPAPARGGVLLMQSDLTARDKPCIETSDIRGSISDSQHEETRRLFETEYCTHKKHLYKRPRRSTSARRPPKPKVEAVRKSSRLASRAATPIDVDSSATDISVAGSTRSASIISIRNSTPKPRPKLRPPTSNLKIAARSKASSDRDQAAPQSTSIAYTPKDAPPPAPTNIVSLRPGYNAYTPEDKRWFLDFVAWVFRQNVRAGKAEICQDIFQQAPHHRLESWKSYWRDHISEVESLRNAARAKRVAYPGRVADAPRPDNGGSFVLHARPPTSGSASSYTGESLISASSSDTSYDSIKTNAGRTSVARSGHGTLSSETQRLASKRKLPGNGSHDDSRPFPASREADMPIPPSKRPRW